jgi:hypothetical protein
MSEKLTKADDLCNELAETLSETPDDVEITVTIPDSGDSSTTTVTDKEITLMAESGLFGLDGGIQARIELDATLTEHLSAVDNTDDSIDGAAKITHTQNGTGVWQVDGGEELEEDPDEYRVECSCGESFGSWGKATRHADEEH